MNPAPNALSTLDPWGQDSKQLPPRWANDQLSHSNKQLQIREERLQNLIHHIPGMVYEGGPDWNNKVISQSEAMCGYTPQELLSQEITWLNIIDPADREKVRLESASLSGEVTSMIQRYRILHKNGEIRWVEDHKASIIDENGAYAGVDGIVFDITERVSTERAFNESEARFRSFFENAADGFLVAELHENHSGKGIAFCISLPQKNT